MKTGGRKLVSASSIPASPSLGYIPHSLHPTAFQGPYPTSQVLGAPSGGSPGSQFHHEADQHHFFFLTCSKIQSLTILFKPLNELPGAHHHLPAIISRPTLLFFHEAGHPSALGHRHQPFPLSGNSFLQLATGLMPSTPSDICSDAPFSVKPVQTTLAPCPPSHLIPVLPFFHIIASSHAMQSVPLS